MNMKARAVFRSKLILPETSKSKIKFTTLNGLLIATDYIRVVVGDRGPYIEFEDSMIVKENIHIPKEHEYRLTYPYCFYLEYRSNDDAYVKLYHQKKTVGYADYKIGLWYISPLELTSKEYKVLARE